MKTRLLIIVFLFAAVAASGLYFFADKQTPPLSGNPETASLYGKLKSFEPGATVRYKIVPEEGLSVSGEAITDAEGSLNLPPYNLYDAAGRNLAYNFQVEESKSEKPLDVAVNMDAVTGTISVGCSGGLPFTPINQNGQLTRADWAGVLRHQAAGNLGVIENEDGFQIAFYSTNLMDDAMKNAGGDPKIIQVLAAPGGGNIVDTPNKYNTPYGCTVSGASTQFSFCRGTSWLQINHILNNYVRGLMAMTQQFTTVMMHQMAGIGIMLDAKMQLETQRELQALTAAAHKDYHPSQLMCEFGSFTKSLGAVEEKAAHEKLAINDMLHSLYSNLDNSTGAGGPAQDVDARVTKFRNTYCDVEDNNSGLHYMCDHDQVGAGTAKGGPTATRRNRDIDYTRVMDQPLTLDIDFSYTHPPPAVPPTRASTPDEEDVLALAKHLYWPDVLPVDNPEVIARKFSKYIDIRTLFAMTNVAHNSFATIAAMKSKSEPSRDGTGAVINDGPAFMKSMMRNFGMSDLDIVAMMGKNPSYWAQMEVLTKKIYQSPDFYTNLYDKPANVDRIGVTLEAIKIMQGRDAFEAALRREMLTSLMVEEALAKHVDNLNGRVVSDIKNLQRR